MKTVNNKNSEQHLGQTYYYHCDEYWETMVIALIMVEIAVLIKAVCKIEGLRDRLARAETALAERGKVRVVIREPLFGLSLLLLLCMEHLKGCIFNDLATETYSYYLHGVWTV